MIDISKAIIPKSDQLNADDFVSGPKTIKITGVKIVAGDQPVSISYEGDAGKPWKPCKSMCRVLVQIWGHDGEKYVGQSITLYNELSVKWAGAEVGGIRISHISGIDKPLTLMLTASRGNKKPYKILPIVDNTIPKNKLTEEEFTELVEKMEACTNMDELGNVASQIKKENYDDEGTEKLKVYYSTRLNTIREGEKV